MANEHGQSIQATVVCTFVLFLQVWVSALQEGGAKSKLGTRPPEDTILNKELPQNFGLQKKGEESAEDKANKEYALRWGRILGNDLQNIPLGLIVAWSDIFGQGDPIVHIIAISIFTAMRVFFTICFAYGLQPWRTITFVLANFSVWTLGINAIIGAFKNF